MMIGASQAVEARNCSAWMEILKEDQRFGLFAALVEDMDDMIMTRNGEKEEDGRIDDDDAFTILAPVDEAVLAWQRAHDIGDGVGAGDLRKPVVDAILRYHFLVD